jgi:hypothetical protein
LRVRLSLRFAFRDLAHEIDDAPTHLAVADFRKSPVQLKALGCRNHIRNKLFSAVFKAGLDAQGRGCALEKIGRRCIKQARDRLQSARAYAIGAFFVFLNLLESHPKRISELFLAQAKHHSAEPDSASDMLIDRVWIFCQGHLRSRFQAMALTCRKL